MMGDATDKLILFLIPTALLLGYVWGRWQVCLRIARFIERRRPRPPSKNPATVDSITLMMRETYPATCAAYAAKKDHPLMRSVPSEPDSKNSNNRKE